MPAKVDLFEINEAFASVAIHSMRDLDIGSVVVNGGAIAIGHPPASSTSTYQPQKAAQLRTALRSAPSARASHRLGNPHPPRSRRVHPTHHHRPHLHP
ncbi:MAG: hypothetical protein WBL53_03370, partial [Pseudonocardiaceae bacterium]